MNVNNLAAAATKRESGRWSTASNASDSIITTTIDDNNSSHEWTNNNKIDLQKFLLRIPKADLHIHLDGSIRIETLIDLAQQYNVELPSYDAQELKDLVFPEKYNSLEEYLRGFGYITKVLLTPEALERVAYEVTMDAYNCGVRHIEIRFAPQMHAIPGKFSIEQVICAVNRGMERAVCDADELDALSRYLHRDDNDDDDLSIDTSKLDPETRDKIQQLIDKQGMHPYHPEAPPHQYGIITCAMRFFLPVFSPYYEAFWEVHKGEDLHRVFGLASVALVTAVNNLRRKGRCCHDCECGECPHCDSSSSYHQNGISSSSSDNDGDHGYILPVVAVDIAGSEVGYPASDHREAFDLAHQSFLHKTVHAGEAYGPESIMEAVTDLHAERIGHGSNLFKWEIIGEGEGRGGKSSSSSSRSSSGKSRNEMTDTQKQQYCDDLTRYLGTMRLCIEVCLSSNLQTIPELEGDLRKHPAKKMIQEGLAVAFCTDNTCVSRTDIVRELSLAAEAFQLTPGQLRTIVFNGFKRSFMAKRYSAKREYNRRCVQT